MQILFASLVYHILKKYQALRSKTFIQEDNQDSATSLCSVVYLSSIGYLCSRSLFREFEYWDSYACRSRSPLHCCSCSSEVQNCCRIKAGKNKYKLGPTNTKFKLKTATIWIEYSNQNKSFRWKEKCKSREWLIMIHACTN